MRLVLVLISALVAGANAAEPYAPPVKHGYPNNVYWGDTHVHTYLSGDAFSMGNLITPDQAYRFAKGETIRATGGDEERLRRPLDFLMVSDHAENLGVLPRLAADELREKIYDVAWSGDRLRPRKANSRRRVDRRRHSPSSACDPMRMRRSARASGFG